MTTRHVSQEEANSIAYEAYRLSEMLKEHKSAKSVKDAVFAMQKMGLVNDLFLESLILSLLGLLEPVTEH
jgi:hypothetical protein